MYIDKQLQVSDAQAVTASAASTDVIDYGQTNPNSGLNDNVVLAITVDEAATAAGAATVVFSVQDSADNSSFADVYATTTIGKATLVAGYQILIPMPYRHRRYVRVYYTVATGPLTAGKFSAQVVTGVQQNTAYPDSPKIT
jgi:hypothetical protein